MQNSLKIDTPARQEWDFRCLTMSCIAVVQRHTPKPVATATLWQGKGGSAGDENLPAAAPPTDLHAAHTHLWLSWEYFSTPSVCAARKHTHIFTHVVTRAAHGAGP